jgi:hypothetical protein
VPDLESAAAELYALPPGEFTARRSALAAQAREAGAAGDAKTIAALRRPTVSAWLVNQLVSGDAGSGDESGDGPGEGVGAVADIDELESLGAELREAQAALTPNATPASSSSPAHPPPRPPSTAPGSSSSPSAGMRSSPRWCGARPTFWRAGRAGRSRS